MIVRIVLLASRLCAPTSSSRTIAAWTAALMMFVLSGARGQVVTISPDITMRDAMNVELLGWVDKSLLFFITEGQRFSAWALDDKMYVKWDREVFLGDKRVNILRAIGWEDQFHVVCGLRDRGDFRIFHRVFDGQANLVDSADIAVIESVFLTPQVYLKVSDDKSKVLIFTEDQQTLRCWSYDLGSRTLLWKASIVFQGQNLYRDYNNMLVTNAGAMYVLMRPGNADRVQNLELFYTLPGAPGKVWQESIPIGGMQVYDYHADFDNRNGCLVLSGFYTDRNLGRALGFFFGRLFPDRTPTVTLLPFDLDLLSAVYGRNVTLDKGLSDFRVRDVALRQDGGAILIAEMRREYARRSTMPMRRGIDTYAAGGWIDYYYEDVILMAVNPDGTEHWRQVLRKKQYSQDDNARYSSFFLFRSPEKLKFLFNDEIKQENTIGGYEVTGTGHLERKTIFNTDYHRLKMRFRDGEQVAYNECIIPSERSNKINLVRIQFAE